MNRAVQAIDLLDVERRLALFAQAITGSAYEVRASESFTGTGAIAHDASGAVLHAAPAMLSSNALYLPSRFATHAEAQFNRRGYRLLALHQLGYREFGTFEFRIATAIERSPTLGTRRGTGELVRESDFDAFYTCFTYPPLAHLLLRLFEAHRIDCRMLTAYPGIQRDYRREAAAELARRRPLEFILELRDVLEAVLRFTLGAPPGELIDRDASGVVDALLALTATVQHMTADVYTTAAAVVESYAVLESAGLVPAAMGALISIDADATRFELERPPMHGAPPLEWLQRDDRIDDWDEELAGLDAAIATSASDAEGSGGDAGAERPPDIEVRRRSDARDTLARRLDMERNNVRHALGDDGKPVGVSYLYDEWDANAQQYLRGWCRLYERRAEAGDATAVADLLRRIAPHEQRVRRQFQQLPLHAYQRTRRVLDGEELDWDQILDHQIDRRRGAAPDERVYQRRDRITRDVAAVFLIDLSASTDDPVLPPEPGPLTPNADDDDPLWQPAARADRNAPPPRRIIDVLRDSIALMARALDTHGDAFAVYGFSGYGRDCVEYYVAKEFTESFRGASLKALVGMRPRRSTRMGPAIRHSTVKLGRTGSALKVLIMLSDGFPQDCDYGPDRSDHEYGVADTAQALAEAARAGVQTFCVTVDRSGHDYLKRMCPDDRYLLIEDIEALPDALTKVYQKLTA